MSELKTRLADDVKAAMRAGEKQRLTTLRMVMAAIKQREVDDRIELDDAAVTAVLEKMVKQRKESVQQYETAGRKDLADKEQAEIELLRSYLPEPLDDAALSAIIDEIMAATGASSMQDMGRVMGAIKKAVAGRADMGKVSALVKQRLSG